MILCLRRSFLFPKTFYIQINASYAKKADGLGKGKSFAGGGPVRKKLPVETDPVKLTTFVCGLNFYNKGEEVKLKPDEEYPDWLWSLRTGMPPSLDELDSNTIEYWERAAELQKERKLRIMKGQRLERREVNFQDKINELKRIRFRALAGYHYNIGIEREE